MREIKITTVVFSDVTLRGMVARYKRFGLRPQGRLIFLWLRNVINHSVISQKFYKRRAKNCQLQPNFDNFSVL